MSQLLLKATDLSKSFPHSESVGQRLLAMIRILCWGQPKRTVPVLEDISFEVHQGQSFAIIGGNGAGKSTLLKLITGVLEPSSGNVQVVGSTAALLELGAGFDPEQTGLENLHMNAAFLGLRPRQVSAHLDEILEFADIGEAIHEPVKHYSSGMVVRLGFAVIAVVKPDLLITDEVLAVGDESFQKKCIRWIEQYLNDGGTLLMVSHNMYQVQKLCKEAIWLQDGKVREKGEVFSVTQRYLAWHERKDAKAIASEPRAGFAGQYQLIGIEIEGKESQEASFEMGESLTVCMEVKSPDGRAPVVLVGVVKADGTPVYGVATDHDNYPVLLSAGKTGKVKCHFDNLALLPGAYQIRAHTLDPEGLRIHDTLECSITIMGQTRQLGSVHLPHYWECE